MKLAPVLRMSATIHLLCLAPALYAQGTHSDVRFYYETGKIEIETDNNRDIGEGEFGTSGPFQQFDANPGFASEVDVGMGINSGDIIVYNVLDDLYFWGGTSFGTLDPGVQIRIENNLGPDTIVDHDSGIQLGNSEAVLANVIDQADSSGDFHAHVDFFLEPLDSSLSSPAFGAYGLKLSLITDAKGIGDSDPFFITFNFGIDSEQFTEAINAFEELLERLPGDYDADGDVDGRDVLVWQRGGSPNPLSAGDLTDWQSNYGAIKNSALAATTAVPEPKSVLLTTVAVSSLVLPRLCRQVSFKPLEIR